MNVKVMIAGKIGGKVFGEWKYIVLIVRRWYLPSGMTIWPTVVRNAISGSGTPRDR